MPTSVIAAVAADALATAVADAVIFDIAFATTLDWVTTYAVIQGATSLVAGTVIKGALSGGSSAPEQTSSSGFTAAATQRTHIIRSAVANRTVVYGRSMVSGPLVFGETGADNGTIYLVVPIAGHEIDAVEDVYFNDEAIGTRDSGGTVTTGTYAGYANVRVHYGALDQVADAALIAAGVNWTADHRLAGVAYLIITLNWSRDIYPRGIPNVKAVVRGKKLHDPRTGLTVWSDNWALAIRDYLTASYGLACTDAEIDDAYFVAAANVADEAIALAAGGSEKRYTCNGVVDLGSTPRSIMEGMLTAGAGFLTWPAGRYRLHAGVYTAPDITLNEDDLRGPIKVRPRLGRRDLFNAVRGTYVDPAKFWQPGDFPPISNATYAAQDGGQTIWRDTALPYTTSGVTAQRIARLIVERSRQGITVDFPAKLTAFDVAAMETVRLDIGKLGWSGKEFKVIDWAFAAEGGVDLTLQEEAAASYDWNSGLETTIDPASDTNLPNPFTVAAPGVPVVSESLYETTGSAGVKAKASIAVAAPDDAFIEFYQYEWRVTGDTAWTVLGRSTSVALDVFDVTPGRYDVRVKAINGLGVSSAYAQRDAVEILGLAAPPAALAGLSLQAAGGLAILTWPLHPDLDVRIGGRIRVRHCSLMAGASWETSVSIGEAVAGNTTVAVLPLKEGTYLARPEDSSGILAASAVMVSTKQASALAWSPLTNVQEDNDYTGTHDKTFAAAGLLQLGGGTLFDSLGGLFDDLGSFDYAGGVASLGTYDFATGIDLGSVQRVRLTSTIAADALNVSGLFDDRVGLLDAWAGDFDGTQGAPVDAWVEVRETDDNPAGTPVWSDWRRLDAAEFQARAFDLRAKLASSDPSFTIRLSQLRVAAANL